MHSYWIKGIPPKEVENRKRQVQGYSSAFKDLKEILTDQVKKKDMVRDYGTPNWEYRQIAANEYNQAIDDLLKILEIN